MNNYLKLFLFGFQAIFLLSNVKIECYYVLPLKTSYDYEGEDIQDRTKIMHNFLTNNIYTEISIGNKPQNLALFIKSRDYCSYIGSYLCHIENSNYDSTISEYFENTTPYNLKFKDFSNVCLANEEMKLSKNYDKYKSNLQLVNFNQFYHAPNNSYSSDNPNTCGVFGLKYKSDKSIEGEDKCLNLINSLYNIPENKINYQVFSIKYIKNDKDIDGKLIIGNYPHQYDSDNYDEDNFVKVNLNETSLEENNDFHTTFYEIFFYRNNKIDVFTEKRSEKKPENLHSIFIIEQNMFMVPQSFFDLYIENFFKDYINNEVCEVVSIDLSKYNTIICTKSKISSLTAFYETFPTVFFFHFGFNETFEFTRKELLVEDNGLIYFMMFTDEDNKNDNYWGIGKIFMQKYLLTFDYDNHILGYYNATTKKNEKDEFDFFENGVFVMIILGANILVVISCALYGIIHKCTKSKIDPTIMIESFSKRNDENLKEKEEEENNNNNEL